MTPKWWEEAVFYQIYPRSFADSNGDGIGDLPGIIDKLDYLQWLGVGAIWLSPHYPSPQIDVGYDIADYTMVEPAYGTMYDFDCLLEAIHARGMKLILDLVLNHTSDQHPWFLAARADRNDPKRDWYVWRDGHDGGPPNNWQSEFGGSTWEYDPATEQYFYHYFLKSQPDLNWRNPEVKAAMFDAARFWLDKGVDGFRLDAIGTLYEEEHFTPHTSRFTAIDALRSNWLHDKEHTDARYDDIIRDLFKYQRRQPEGFALMEEFRDILDEYDDRFLVGETSDPRFLGASGDRLHAIFNFDILYQPRLSANGVRAILKTWHGKTPRQTWVCNTLNNHDQSRAATHFAPDDPRQSRSAMALVLLLEGLPFLYYGEEIGMRDYAIQSLYEMRDRVGDVYRAIRLQDGIDEQQILHELGTFSRDRCRTPMQWDRSANAGFSPEGAITWLPVNANHLTGINVAEQTMAKDSLLSFTRELIRLRHNHIALQIGSYTDLDPLNESVLIFSRTALRQCCTVAINFTPEARPLPRTLDEQLLYADDGASVHQLPPYGVLVLETKHPDT